MFNFEFHITVENNIKLDFDSACKMFGAKSINIVLPNAPSQLMSSLTTKLPDLNSAISLVEEHSLLLKSLGFNVLRLKVEVEPKYLEMFPDTKYYYLEVHVPTKTNKLNNFDMDMLQNKWHKSANEFKKDVTMLTFRTCNVSEMDTAKTNDFELLKGEGLVKVNEPFIVEFAVFDTKEGLDYTWLNS